MSIIRLQGDKEKQKRIYYEFDADDAPLGEGGMGKVYKGACVDERTGVPKAVAIKFMFSDLPEHAIERARREASIQLHNDNLVEMLGFIETTEFNVMGEAVKRYHVVSELLEGVMLDDLLQGKVSDQLGQIIPFAEELYRDMVNDRFKFAVSVIRSVLSGVMALHDAGYIHRDIDPTNIMVTRSGRIKLIDFGIAKPINTLTTHDKALTTAGVFIGKPWYAAPELVLGDIRHQNATTDIYAIGILFYQLYVGSRPFEGPHHLVLDMQLHKQLPLGNVSRKDVKAIIAKATHKKQDLRYQSAAEFRVDLDKLPAIPSKPVPWKFAGAVVGGAALVVGALFLFLPGRGEPVPDGGQAETSHVSHGDYSSAVKLLNSQETAREGLQLLEALSAGGDYDATYLLSRLKFDAKGKREFDNIPDSIWTLQLTSKIDTDNRQAHELLKKAVEINPDDCDALYALGVDYLVGDRETLEGRQIAKSKACLERALQLARKENNTAVIRNIERLFEEYAAEFGTVERR